MGLCASSENSGANSAEAAEARKRSKGVEKALRDESEKDKAVNKLLLLGAGESGKSTLFKQMISIYGKGFSEEDRKGFRSVIHNNILTSMRTLLEQVEKMAEHGIDASIKQDLVPSANYVLELKTTDLNEISPDLALHLAALWLDPGVQTVYANRSKFQLTDLCAYFLDKVVECAEPNYIPSSEDVLHSRVRTTGIVENTFVIEENEFKMYDVGGQRNERKKWIHCFEEVTAVLFVAALSEYDLRLFEDENVNRMTEAITLFADIVNSRWFKNSAMILLLNKTDLFEKKIEIVPITVCFPEYTGPGDSTSAAGFIEQQFRNQVKDPKKPIYVYFTNATNTNMMRNVFSAVKDIVIRKSLQEGGLLG